jgi:hypothetical protein
MVVLKDESRDTTVLTKVDNRVDVLGKGLGPV